METINQSADKNVINTGTSHSYYKHSGAFSPLAPVIVLGSGIIGAIILSFIYSYATYYIPFVYLNILLTIGLGLGLGAIVGIAGMHSKVRNNALMALFGIIIGLVAEYGQWVFWILAESKQKLFLLNPADLFVIIQYLAVDGVWSIRSFTPTGNILYSIWFVEAAIIIVTTTLMSVFFLNTSPFCEKCNEWADKKETLFPLGFPINSEKLKTELEKGNFSALTLLGTAKPSSAQFTTVELQYCPHCNDLYLISVTSSTMTVNSKGEQKEDKNEIVQNLIIDQRVYNSLKNWNSTLLPLNPIQS